MRVTLQRLSAIAFGWMLLSAAPAFSQTGSSSGPDGFPESVWSDHKKVTQIPWEGDIGKARLRSDFRLELNIWLRTRPTDTENHDFILFARVLKDGKPITPVRSEAPSGQPLPSVSSNPAVSWGWIAIVRPGKYKLELALLDRATGRYSTRYEDISVPGNENDPLEQALREFPEFEFVEQAKFDARDRPMLDLTAIMRRRTAADIANPMRLPPALGSPDVGVSTRPAPSFIIDGPGTLHLSVLAIVSPPEAALVDPYYESLFHGKLLSFLSAFRRIDVVRGSAKFTAVDLANRTLVLDRRDMKDVTLDMIDSAINREVHTVSVDALKGSTDSGRFFQDVLRAQFEAAEKETGGAEHVFIVVAARSDFPKGSSLLPPSSVQACRCRVIYVRFALQPNETDDLDDVLKPYKPRVFEPLDFPQFRKDFGTIYQQLTR